MVSNEKKNEKWMENLPKCVTTQPFNCIAIPGSHDSATYSFEPSLGIAVDESWFIQTFGIKSIVSNWAKTQTWSLGQQLEAGIRYFDFRVAVPPCPQKKEKEIRFVHGLYGELVSIALREINSFLETNCKEVVVLDFNHFYNMEEGDHTTLLEEIRNTFNQKLIPMNTHYSKLTFTLERLWETKGRVIIFYHYSKLELHPVIWKGNLISSPWAQTDDSNALIKSLGRNYSESKEREGNMYVWQGVVTPSKTDVVLHFWSSLEVYLAREATEKFVNWLKDEKHPGPNGINICAADFVDQSGYISTVIELNKKMQCKNQSATNHVKSECTVEEQTRQ